MKVFNTTVKMTDCQATKIMTEALHPIDNKNNIDGTINAVIAMEEFSECTKEISKFLRGKGNRDNLIEEIADVHICMKELQLIFRISDEEIDKVMMNKLDRQAMRNKKYED